MTDVQYLIDIIRPLLTDPDSLNVERTTDDRGTLLTVSVTKADIGRIIGKAGETARSIRRLMHQFGSMTDERLSVKINEPTV
jgi:uncharacterized protein